MTELDHIPRGSGDPRRLVDPFGRRLHYLRLSVTDLCNQRCLYCMPQSGIAKLTHQEILSLEEQARVARVAHSLGVDKIRLTGGEPLLRRDLPVLLQALGGLDPRPDLRLTTNGRLLAAHLDRLVVDGVKAVNISLDTLQPQRYGLITGLGLEEGLKAFAAVWEGIQAALARPGLTVKLNLVLLNGLNHDELADFARLTLELPLAVRFIEYMPVGAAKAFTPERFLSADQALAVMVFEDGVVENRLMRLAAGVTPSSLQEASNFMNARLRGRTLGEAGLEIRRELEAARRQLNEAAARLVEDGKIGRAHV